MKLYKRVIKKPWPYIIGGSLLAILNILLLLFTNTSLRITSGILYFGAGLLELLGFNPSEWYYFKNVSSGFSYSGETYLFNYMIILDVAIIVGALIACLLASEFKIRKIKNKNQIFFGLLGGLMMGYGARLSFGCNIGAFFSAIPSMSLHGWVFALSMFIGAFLGSKILMRYLM